MIGAAGEDAVSRPANHRAIDRVPVIFFEPESSGHRWEHVRHLLTALATTEFGLDVTFLVHPDIARRADAHIVRHQLVAPAGFQSLSPRDQRASVCKPLWLRALRRWQIMNHHLTLRGARHWHFMYLDHIQLPLALMLPIAQRATVSGVLFQPSVHYRAMGSEPLGFGERSREWRKGVMSRRMLRHPGLVAAFSLDPFFPAYAARHYECGQKVREVPDPLPVDATQLLSIARQCLEGRSSLNRIYFLLFGALTERKGIFAVLDALETLDATTASRIAIVFAGELDRAVRSQFMRRVRELLHRRPNIIVQMVDRFVEEVELTELVSACDWILLPYQRFVGSSGVLMWAAAAQKPVVSQDYGLVGALVRRYRLGIVADTTNPDALAVALRQAVTAPFSTQRNRPSNNEFLRNRTPQGFASAILRGISDCVLTRK